MQDDMITGAEAISMFCRLNMNIKRNLPVRSSEMGLLILIVKNNGAVTPVMAADFFGVKKPMITTMVASLEKDGYITRVLSSKDRRSFSIEPTEKARVLVDTTYEEYLKTMNLLKCKLGVEDFEMLITLVNRANNILLEDKNNG